MANGAATTPRYYWDSCVFLSYLENNLARVSHIESILNKAAEREVQVLTSTLSITEVAYTSYERERRVLQLDEEERIEGLWYPPVMLIEYHRGIATEARRLIRESFQGNGPTLKPADAIHAATACLHEATAFHTYDEKLARVLSTLLAFEVGPPLADQLSIALVEVNLHTDNPNP